MLNAIGYILTAISLLFLKCTVEQGGEGGSTPVISSPSQAGRLRDRGHPGLHSKLLAALDKIERAHVKQGSQQHYCYNKPLSCSFHGGGRGFLSF